jgi:autotransporter-associated beta strand protein
MKRIVKCLVIAGGFSSPAWGQTTINGDNLALQSSGAAAGSAWTLSSDGYVGTYINLSTAAPVTFTVDASGVTSGGLSPDMTLSIADSNQSFPVSSGTLNNYTYTTPTLAPGTYFVRTQLDNQTATQTPDLTVGSLTVAGSGVSVLNSNTSTNALNAATTYATNYRQGPGTITLTNGNGYHLGAGTSVQVKLIDNSFNFAAAVYGGSPYYEPSLWLNYNSSGQNLAPTTSEQINYQKAILANFNMIVPANAGKWVNNESSQGSVNMWMLDAMSQFAAQNGLGIRMHNLLWATEQPGFVSGLFTGTPGSLTAANKTTLNNDINSRISYYVSGKNTSTSNTPRTDSYAEMDVVNEPFHNQGAAVDYLNGNALGVSGVANVYSEVASAVAAAGAKTRLDVNEYNVLQYSPQSIDSSGGEHGSDPYANWYLNGVQQIQRAGGPISGIGMELYINDNNLVSPAQMLQAMQNLSVAKDPSGNPMPLSLTEFGANNTTPTVANYDTDLTTALTMAYGDPQTTTFGYWGGVGGPTDPAHGGGPYALYDANYNLTQVGQTWQNWMSQYNTNDTLTTNANGQISFNGTYGLYDVIVGGQTYQLDLVKGTTNYGLMTPISGAMWNGGGSTSNWSNSANWGATSLTTNAPLVFAGTTGLAPNNDSAAGTTYAGITFNAGAGPFVVAGNAIVLGGDIVNNSANLQTINLPLALQQNTNFNAASGNLAIGGVISGSYSLTKLGSHSLTLAAANLYTGSTTVSAGTLLVGVNDALPNSSVSITGGTLQLGTTTGLAQMTSLSITGNGVLDVNNDHIIITYGSSDPFSTIAGYIKSGYNGGGWNGPGIISTAALTPTNGLLYGLGYADGADGTVSGLASGQIEVMYTLLGDANLDGIVNAADFTILAANFNQPVTGWDQGDFNYDGLVNAADFTDLAANFNQSDSGANSAGDVAALDAFAAANGFSLANVPEPNFTALAGLVAIGALQRRARRTRAS